MHNIGKILLNGLKILADLPIRVLRNVRMRGPVEIKGQEEFPTDGYYHW